MSSPRNGVTLKVFAWSHLIAVATDVADARKQLIHESAGLKWVVDEVANIPSIFPVSRRRCWIIYDTTLVTA